MLKGDSSSSKLIQTMYGPKDANASSLATFGQQGQLTIHSATSPVSPQSLAAESPPKEAEMQAKKPKATKRKSKATKDDKSTVDKYIKSALERQITRKVTQLNQSVLRTRNISRSSHNSSVNTTQRLSLNQAALQAVQ